MDKIGLIECCFVIWSKAMIWNNQLLPCSLFNFLWLDGYYHQMGLTFAIANLIFFYSGALLGHIFICLLHILSFGILQVLQEKKSWNTRNPIGPNVGLLPGLFIFPHFATYTLTVLLCHPHLKTKYLMNLNIFFAIPSFVCIMSKLFSVQQLVWWCEARSLSPSQFCV